MFEWVILAGCWTVDRLREQKKGGALMVFGVTAIYCEFNIDCIVLLLYKCCPFLLLFVYAFTCLY